MYADEELDLKPDQALRLTLIELVMKTASPDIDSLTVDVDVISLAQALKRYVLEGDLPEMPEDDA